MNKKYKLISNKLIIASILAIFIILLVGIIVNSITLAEAIKLDSPITIPLVWIISCIIELAILAVLVFNRHIRIKDKGITIVLGVYFNRLSYEDILLIREDRSSKLMLLYFRVYNKAGEELVNYRAIPIGVKHYDSFISDIRSHNSDVKHEIFNKSSASSEDNQ